MESPQPASSGSESANKTLAERPSAVITACSLWMVQSVILMIYCLVIGPLGYSDSLNGRSSNPFDIKMIVFDIFLMLCLAIFCIVAAIQVYWSRVESMMVVAGMSVIFAFVFLSYRTIYAYQLAEAFHSIQNDKTIANFFRVPTSKTLSLRIFLEFVVFSFTQLSTMLAACFFAFRANNAYVRSRILVAEVVDVKSIDAS